MSTFGPEIRRKRKLLHLSQEELAKRVGCTQGAISQVENGMTGSVSAETAARICEELGIDPALSQVREEPSLDLHSVFCSKATCPMNRPYLVEGELHFMPRYLRVDRKKDVYCPGCGTPMIDRCPNARCQQPIREGFAFCMSCGQPLVPVPDDLRRLPDPKALVNELNEQARELNFEVDLLPPVETAPQGSGAKPGRAKRLAEP